MKKNLILSAVLAILVIATYFLQELKTEKQLNESLTKDHLIKSEEIKTLSWGDVEAVKRNGQWWSGDKLLSHNIFSETEKKIAHIKKLKTVDGAIENYFTNSLDFKVNGEQWRIGDLTLDRQGFYLYRNKAIMVAMMDGASGELTDDETKFAEIKLDELKKAFSFKLAELIETQLFRYYPSLPLGKVLIESEGRPRFELDFLSNQTMPPPIEGVVVHDKILEKFSSLLTQMTLKKEVSYSEGLKKSLVGKITFEKNDEKETWELWLASEKSADSYIIDSKRKKAWLMIGGTLKIFFIHNQDYWDKKVIPQHLFQQFSRLKVHFYQDDKSAEVEVVNREPLAFETSQFKIDQMKMNILFQYVFNLSDKDQADRVSQLSKSERKELLSGSHLRLEVLNQEILFWRKAHELILVNLTQGFKAHFLIRDESFSASFADMLK